MFGFSAAADPDAYLMSLPPLVRWCSGARWARGRGPGTLSQLTDLAQSSASGWPVALRQCSPRIAAIASSVSPEGCQRRRKRLRLPTVSLLAAVASTEESVSVAPEFR